VHGRRAARFMLPFAVAAALYAVCPAGAKAAPSLSTAKARAQQLEQTVSALAGRLSAAVQQYQTATDRLALVAARVVEDQRQLAEAQQELSRARRDLTALAVGMYKQSPTSVLDMFVGVGSLEDLVTRVHLLDSVGQNTAEILQQCRQRSDQMQQRQMQVQADQLQARQLVEQIAQQKEQLGAALEQNKAALGKAKADVQRIAKEILAERAAAAAARAAVAGGSIRSVPLTGILAAYSQRTWAQTLLKNLGVPISAANVSAMVSWEMAEGGHWYNTARFNPLNTTMSEPGATAMNSVGVKAYASWEQGFAATIATLFNGYYAGIIAALERGDDAQAVANAVAASPWGTGSFSIRSW
jgi:peptidoglycan hydrolase CwlO-like protein